jgi:deazaflavin-dependent oxidoreductase (nitroreductase family)
VEVQVLDDRFTARARTATPDEKQQLWERMVSEWPDYDAYQQRTERDIPVVVLERA